RPRRRGRGVFRYPRFVRDRLRARLRRSVPQSARRARARGKRVALMTRGVDGVRHAQSADAAPAAPQVASPSTGAARDPVALAAADLEDGEVVILAIRPHPLFILFASAGSLLALAIALLLTVFIARNGWLPIDAGVVTTY